MYSNMKKILFWFAFILVINANSAKERRLVQVNDDNWSQILEGEWMVEFFAPWCPACRSLQPVWEEFASWSTDLSIQIGQVDITHSPGLSGRFMITALPTIYHIKDGSFRQYRGPRTKEDFLTFIEEKKWQGIDALSAWQSPSSLQMSLISQFYRVSMTLRNVMNVMLEDYGIPAWAAYLVFGVATILVGLVLGLILVCIIDCIYPPSIGKKSDVRKQEKSSDADDKEKTDDDELTEDQIVDDDESQQDDNSQAEADDADMEEKEKSKPRRRKIQKAD
jgi:hypothetical protein